MALSIPDLSKVIILEFQLTFATDKAMKAWAHNSIGGVLKTLLLGGLIERIDAPKTEWGGPTGKWQWMSGPEASLNELRPSAVAAGTGVKQAKRRGRQAKQKPAQALPAV